MYKIDIAYIIKSLLPVEWRQSKHLSWLNFLSSYISKIAKSFLDFTIVKEYDKNFTGQIIYLTKKLNDNFGLNEVRIDDGDLTFPIYLVNKDEGIRTEYFGNLWISDFAYNTGNVIAYNNNFYKSKADDNEEIPTNTIYWELENGDLLKFYNKTEFIDNIDFFVSIQRHEYISLKPNQVLKIKAMVEYYKPIDKSYQLRTYTN